MKACSARSCSMAAVKTVTGTDCTWPHSPQTRCTGGSSVAREYTSVAQVSVPKDPELLQQLKGAVHRRDVQARCSALHGVHDRLRRGVHQRRHRLDAVVAEHVGTFGVAYGWPAPERLPDDPQHALLTRAAGQGNVVRQLTRPGALHHPRRQTTCAVHARRWLTAEHRLHPQRP